MRFLQHDPGVFKKIRYQSQMMRIFHYMTKKRADGRWPLLFFCATDFRMVYMTSSLSSFMIRTCCWFIKYDICCCESLS